MYKYNIQKLTFDEFELLRVFVAEFHRNSALKGQARLAFKKVQELANELDRAYNELDREMDEPLSDFRNLIRKLENMNREFLADQKEMNEELMHLVKNVENGNHYLYNDEKSQAVRDLSGNLQVKLGRLIEFASQIQEFKITLSEWTEVQSDVEYESGSDGAGGDDSDEGEESEWD